MWYCDRGDCPVVSLSSPPLLSAQADRPRARRRSGRTSPRPSGARSSITSIQSAPPPPRPSSGIRCPRRRAGRSRSAPPTVAPPATVGAGQGGEPTASPGGAPRDRRVGREGTPAHSDQPYGGDQPSNCHRENDLNALGLWSESAKESELRRLAVVLEHDRDAVLAAPRLEKRSERGTGEPPRARQADAVWSGRIRATPSKSSHRLSRETAREKSGAASPKSRTSQFQTNANNQSDRKQRNA